MLSEDAPRCLCGAHNWEGRGASIGRMTQESFQCRTCGRMICVLWAYSNGVAFQHVLRTGDIGEFTDWANKVLLVTLRAEGEKIEAARGAFLDAAWQTFLSEHNLPADTKEVPEHLQKAKTDWWYSDRASESPQYRRPPGFDLPPLPANVPDNMYLLLVNNGPGERYVPVDNAATKGLPVPADPIRVRHDAYYLPIFAELGIQADELSLIRNEYCGAENEPWYAFTVGTVVFKVGPRKRVTSIQVESDAPLDVRAISAVAQADGVTYYLDGMWTPWEATAGCKAEVHAWSREKVVEYLTLLIAAARNVVAK